MRSLLEQVAQPQSDSTVFIYGLADPENKFIRYVGKSYKPHKRYVRHLSKREISLGSAKSEWIKSLVDSGLKPHLVILEEVDEIGWEEHEQKWINFYRNTPGHPGLTNYGAGGGGGRRGTFPISVIDRQQQAIHPIENSIRHIPLTQGNFAAVDACWYAYLSKFNWIASFDRRAQTYYASRRITVGNKSTSVLMHRVIAGNDFPHVDHKDGNDLNNTQANLRKCTVSQNGANRKLNSNNSSGYKGVYVSRRRGLYCAEITAGGKRHRLGSFVDPREAAKAYDRAAIRHFGEFARTNFSQDYLLS